MSKDSNNNLLKHIAVIVYATREAEVSRLRSAVCLLVKDKPEMLRLLGQ